MAYSRREVPILLVLCGALGCSVGEGQGEIGGLVVANDYCALEEPDYQLTPSFFVAEVVDANMNIRVQRGSDLEQYSDGITITVTDVDEVKTSRIGLPITVSRELGALVETVFYLNETCPSGFPNDHRMLPVVMQGVGGTITFDAIYAPNVDPGAAGIEAELTDVRYEDPMMPEVRNATLNGRFSFFYQRGSPAQRFP